VASDENEITLQDFIALLRYVNKTLEEFFKEAEKFSKLAKRYSGSSYYGAPRFEDVFRAALEASLGARATPTVVEKVEEDAEVKERARKALEKLKKLAEKEGAKGEGAKEGA